MRVAHLFPASALCLAWGVAAAQDLDLVLAHRIRISGQDGLIVTSEFSERFVRRDGQVWYERIVPAALKEAPHTHVGGHRHFNAAGAARWVVADGRKTLRLALVDEEEKMIVEVDRPDYANVGFGSSWEQAYHLIDPGMLSTMQKQGNLKDGGQWYERRRPDGVVRVLWDEALKFPREVETASSNGLNQKSFRATRVASATRELPWQRTKEYERKGYNDLMD